MAFPTRLSFVTYNLWNIMRWPKRRRALQGFFLRFRPDVFCLQELRPETRRALDAALPGYRRVQDRLPGWERESNIYWNSDLLEEVVHGVENIAIRSDPHRGLFWARLRVIATGRTFFISTAHYTYQEHPQELRTGSSPRVEQGHETVDALNRLIQPGEPGFFMGDLNDPILPVRVLANGGYRSCFSRLDLVPPPTWPALPTARTSSYDIIAAQPIDWIVSNDRARPLIADVPHYFLDDVAPSDHWPVFAVYEIE